MTAEVIEEIEKALRGAAQQIGKHMEETRDARLARVFKRIEEIEEEERKNGSSNRRKHSRKLH